MKSIDPIEGAGPPSARMELRCRPPARYSTVKMSFTRKLLLGGAVDPVLGMEGGWVGARRAGNFALTVIRMRQAEIK